SLQRTVLASLSGNLLGQIQLLLASPSRIPARIPATPKAETLGNKGHSRSYLTPIDRFVCHVKNIWLARVVLTFYSGNDPITNLHSHVAFKCFYIKIRAPNPSGRFMKR